MRTMEEHLSLLTVLLLCGCITLLHSRQQLGCPPCHQQCKIAIHQRSYELSCCYKVNSTVSTNCKGDGTVCRYAFNRASSTPPHHPPQQHHHRRHRHPYPCNKHVGMSADSAPKLRGRSRKRNRHAQEPSLRCHANHWQEHMTICTSPL